MIKKKNSCRVSRKWRPAARRRRRAASCRRLTSFPTCARPPRVPSASWFTIVGRERFSVGRRETGVSTSQDDDFIAIAVCSWNQHHKKLHQHLHYSRRYLARNVKFILRSPPQGCPRQLTRSIMRWSRFGLWGLNWAPRSRLFRLIWAID